MSRHQNIPEEKWLAYLEGRLSPEEQRVIEMLLSEEGMESDALEGLTQLKPEEARSSLQKLNYKLSKTISARSRQRTKPILSTRWAILAVLLILLLCMLGYYLVRMVMK